MVDKIYSNYTNYIYKVNLISNEEVYLVFNPSIHYWIAVDKIGKKICECLKNEGSLRNIKEKLINLFQIDDKVYEEDIFPYIQELIEKKFFVYEPTNENADFMSETPILSDITKYPFNEMYISLSDHCNLNCIYCFNKEQRMARLNSANYKTLSLCEICNAILQFKDLGGNRVVLTGGEPTLNENFEKICKFIHEQGLESSFITNGLTLLHKNLNEILPYITSIGLSLDSVFNDELNTLWGIHNDRISHNMLAVLKKLDDWSRDNNQITINIMPISSKVNFQSMAEIIHTIAVSLSHCNVTWQIVKYDKIDNKNVDEMLDITNEEYRISIINGLSSISDENNLEILKYAYSNSGRLLPAKAPKLYTCAPSFFITATGDIKPCQGLDSIALGNIRTTSLKEAFESSEFDKVRNIICKNNINICKDCEFRFVCEAEKRECYKNKDSSADDCRERVIYQLYLETLTGVDTNDRNNRSC